MNTNETQNTDAQPVKRRPGRPRLQNPKQPISIRLSADVLSYFRSTGPGWQSRINKILKDYVEEQQA